MRTVRRLLIRGAGVALVLSALTLYLVHTGPVRRFALGRLQAYLRSGQGLALEVADFDYSLLSSRFELGGVSLKGVPLVDMPAPLTAQRVVVSIPVWRLALGSFAAAQIRIDGLGVHWITAVSGRSNWPAMGGSRGGGVAGGPAVSVTSGELSVQDSRNGFSLHLPQGRLSMVWTPEKREYSVDCSGSGGQVQWSNLSLALDELKVRSVLASSGLSVQSLQLVSGTSRAEANGSLAGSPPQIQAQGKFDIDVQHLSRALGFTTPAQGRVQAAVSASGQLEALQINGRLFSDAVAVRGARLSRAAAEALFDTATGELQVRAVSADLFSGRFTGKARIWTGDNRRRSEFSARLAGLDPAQVARAFSASMPSTGRATVEASGSWPGLDWRRAAIAGMARLGAATVNFNAAGDSDSIRATLDGSLGGGAAAHGDIALGLPELALTGTLTGDVVSLARLGGEVERLLDRPSGSLTQPTVDGAARWSATLGGRLGNPSASVQASVHGLSIGAWRGADLEVNADCAADQVEIRRALLGWGGQEIEVRGNVGGFSADAPVRLEGTVEGQSLTPMFEDLGFASVADAEVSGTVRISGSVGRPRVETTLSLVGLAGRLQASGSLDVSDGRYTFNLTGENLSLGASPPPGGPSLAGTFRVESQGTGTLKDPMLRARVTGSDVRIGGIAVGELRGEVDAKEHRATVLVTAPGLNARAKSTVNMEGTWPFDLSLDAENTLLKTVPEASFDASVRGSGSLTQPLLGRMTGTIRNLRLATRGQETVGDGPIEVAYADGRFQVQRLELTSGESRLRVSGAIPLEERGAEGALTVKGRVVLDPFLQLLPGLDASKTGGIAEVSAMLTGSAQRLSPTGSITIQDGRLRAQSFPFGIEGVSGRLEVENGIIRTDQITGRAGTGTLRIDGSLPLRLLSSAFAPPAKDAGQPARFSAQVEDLRLSGGKGQSAVEAVLGLRIAGESAALRMDALQATVDFSDLRVTAGTSDLRQAAPARIRLTGGVARLESLDTKSANSWLKASGSISLRGDYPLEFDVAGETDPAMFAALAAPLEAAGALRLEAHVGGSLADPRTTGFVTLENAALALPDPRLQATGVRLNATLAGDQIRLGEFTGTLNGGAFSGGGDLKFRGGRIVDANLSMIGKDTFLEYPAGVKTTSSLDLGLVSRDDRLVLSGKVEIQEGYYDASPEAFMASQRRNQVRLGAPEAAASDLALDLSVVTRRSVEMNNSLGRLAANANLRVSGTARQPRLLGTLELEQDGRLYFGDRTYFIERGTVRFVDAPTPTPELNIHAYTRAGDYTVNLGLTGELKEVTTTFTSDPPLARDDVIAVLLTGKTLAENRGVDLRALEASALATGAMNASLSSRLNRTLGVSRVSIQPGAVAAESSTGARITITQDFTRTLRLMYSMNLSDSNDQIWVTEYDLSRRFTTRAVQQSDNSYRGEFRHDVRFGKSSTQGSVAARTPVPKISKVEFTGAGPFSPADLAKRFKVKPGQSANPMKLRKGADKLAEFLVKEGYLESRLHIEREDDGLNLRLTVRIDLGPTVEMAYLGADLPRRWKARLRNIWHQGISSQQRPNAAKDAILEYFAEKGYLRADVTAEVLSKGDHKLVQFDIRPGSRYRNLKIELEGVGNGRTRDILALLKQDQFRLSVYRDGRRASEAMTRFYEQRGYLAAKMAPPVHELDEERQTGRIVIRVDEGPVFRVGAIEFSGNTALSAGDLRAGLPLEAGAVFEPARLEPASAQVKRLYGDLGYGDAEIDYQVARHDDRASIDVSFTIVENKQTSIGAVQVEGNRQTSADFVHSQLEVASGDIANAALLRDSMRNLTQTGAYASADLQLQPPVESGAGDKRVQVANLLVSVTEPKPFRVLYGGLYDSGGGPGFIADFQNRNLLGAGRTLGLRTRVDPETDEVRLYVTRPFWRHHRLSTTISTYFTRETDHYQTVATDKLGISAQQDLPLSSKWLLSYGYRFEKQRGFVQDPAAPQINADVVSVAPATLTISRDARDSFLDATRGSFISHGFEFAPRALGSDYPYARYYVQYFKYFPLTRPRPVPFGEQPQRSRLVFATGSRLGVQKGFNEVGAVLTDRFYAGGGTTVRGFRQDELGPKLSNGQPAGGNAVLVLNEELRYPLFRFFDAVSFVDIGNVFPRVSDFKFSDLRYTGGFGLRIRNPFVVLRFDYGFKLDRRPGETIGAFSFSIGQAF